MANIHTPEELKELQALPLNLKVALTKQRLREWVRKFGQEGTYVSFSGGKDSTVLLDIVRNQCGYTRIPAVFSDTGLEYPEIKDFVKSFDNVEIIHPDMSFKQVVKKYGYPLISKEVAEAVYGAKIYLTKLREANDALTDRQTDRRLPYAQFYRKINGLGEYSKPNSDSKNIESFADESTGGDNDGIVRRMVLPPEGNYL